MPLSHVSKVFAVRDAKVRKITSDPAGGTTVLGTSIDVPGIKQVTIDGDVTTAQLRGDNSKLDQQSSLSGIGVKFNYAKLSLDVLGAVMGGTIVDGGTAPAQSSTLSIAANTTAFSYFEFEAQAVGADPIAGDVRIKLLKCILDAFPGGLGFEEEDYRTFDMSAQAVPRLSDMRWIDITINETASTMT